MKVEVVCRNDEINQILNIFPVGYKEALQTTASAMDTHRIASCWKDSLISGRFDKNLTEFLTVPEYGCMKDIRTVPEHDREKCLDKIWNIGGKTGWHYANGFWRLRGFIDKLFGGEGLRRGLSYPDSIAVGDAVDFWRVLYAN